eukprot:TRINITY_DN17757_c0_g2_i4.p1 TRINITY_DN17757_c0_g2~~TRINITY_DN17757_c0_g2_i4.p1  ORF type:complete len:238 (+),score=88.91 TRINITY_DN17757_c0_g2_i4:93-806(+)
MIRRPPRSTLSSSSAASDVYKRQGINAEYGTHLADAMAEENEMEMAEDSAPWDDLLGDDVPAMDPNDPLLAGVQAAIHKVLAGNHEKLTLELRGQVEQLKRLKAQREESGVELYSVQQQLAKLQMGLERAHEQYNIMAQMRKGSEEDNQQISDAYGSRKAELGEQREKLQKYEGELDKVNLTLRQVESYNEQMRNEISVTRRATYKAEEDISKLEDKQKWQDLYICLLYTSPSPRDS